MFMRRFSDVFVPSASTPKTVDKAALSRSIDVTDETFPQFFFPNKPRRLIDAGLDCESRFGTSETFSSSWDLLILMEELGFGCDGDGLVFKRS